MDDDKPMTEDCGCHCEMCMKGEHDHCTTGLCEYKKAESDEA
ncbi:MAG TPA: hypothetical protein VLG37_04185 [Candidatus Saccharimonadales bacterium]|nr:hypothetical protein [Candidatus Saccharimonadales bacterium]